MSRDYKLNKSELTRLKRQEKLYLQYLPVLKLKQEQLQIEQNRIRKNLELARLNKIKALKKLAPFIKLLPDPRGLSISDVIVVERLITVTKSIAGVPIKTLKSIVFRDIDVPYFQTSAWLLRALPIMKSYLHSEAHMLLLEEENRIIGRELRKATQKVNLFDMVLIPKTKNAIKRIKIALGDEQVASVSRGKIAKSKMGSDEDNVECHSFDEFTAMLRDFEREMR